ncbi:hypothetical protein LCM4576_23525 [Mesorhizobium sp. LCM 4576]|nr:hypothetical protein LCM4576_23525 [Mesorhizobium sp. LCM 4576]
MVLKSRDLASLPPLDEMPDDFALTLPEACHVFFRDMMGPGSLRAARDRGSLAMQRAGRRDWVTAGAMREFLRPGQADDARPAAPTASSDLDRIQAARAAAQLIASRLKAVRKRRPEE